MRLLRACYDGGTTHGSPVCQLSLSYASRFSVAKWTVWPFWTFLFSDFQSVARSEPNQPPSENCAWDGSGGVGLELGQNQWACRTSGEAPSPPSTVYWLMGFQVVRFQVYHFCAVLGQTGFYQSWVDIAELSQVWIVLSLYILFLAVTKQKFSIDLGFITVNRTIKLIKYAQKFWIWGAISASCVSILVVFIKVSNGSTYMGNSLPPKPPDDCQCWAHMESAGSGNMENVFVWTENPWAECCMLLLSLRQIIHGPESS